jgi:diacylglycerol kinase family enzyme
MNDGKRKRERHKHYCLLPNRAASRCDQRAIKRLTALIRKRGGRYTVLESRSALDLHRQAQQVAGRRKRSRYLAQNISKWGPITAAVACGGDGTFNLVAREAMTTDLPVGILPLGRMNNICRSLYGSTDTAVAIEKILAGKCRMIDSARVATQVFFGSIGMGFLPELARLLEEKKRPRFGFGWSQLGARAAADVAVTPLIVKVDSFRFDASPIILSVNLLPWSTGLPLSPASIPDDGFAEIILDHGNMVGEFGTFVRLIHKRKYLYGDVVRMYRGTTVTCQPTRGRSLYLDGELIELSANVLELQVGPHQVKVFC